MTTSTDTDRLATIRDDARRKAQADMADPDVAEDIRRRVMSHDVPELRFEDVIESAGDEAEDAAWFEAYAAEIQPLVDSWS